MMIRANPTVSSVVLPPPPLPQAAEGTKPELKPPSTSSFSRKVVHYTGPADGCSHPRYRRVLVPMAQVLVAGRYRVQIEGAENLRRPGPQLFCPTHPSAFDPGVVVALMGQRDVRYLSNMQMFRGVMGHVFTWIGAFPVNREGASRVTLEHCDDILKQGKSLCIFPEGTLTGLAGQVGPIKKGAAASALTGGAESVIPLAIDYQRDTQRRPVEAVLGAVGSAAIAAAGVLAAAHGGPTAQFAASLLGGSLVGSYLTRNVVRAFVPEGGPQLQEAPKYLAGVAAAVTGAVLAGTAVGLGAHFSPHSLPSMAAATGLMGGASAFGWASIFRHRDIARVIVCDPIRVAPYAEKYSHHDAVVALTNDIHRSLGKAKERLTGVPYDENAPKIGGRVVDGLKGQPLLGEGRGYSFTSIAR